MKKVLKGWLIDNAVTTDNKTDKILLLASAGSLTLDDVLEEMYKQDTGLRPETMRHSVTLYHRIVMDLILNGYSVNTGLFRAVPQLKGVVEGGAWNKENSPESAEEGIGIRQEVLDKESREGQFRPSYKSKYHEESIERLAHR